MNWSHLNAFFAGVSLTCAIVCGMVGEIPATVIAFVVFAWNTWRVVSQ